jgi:hypothetical protein
MPFYFLANAMHKSNRNRAKTCSSHLYSTEGCSVPLLRQGNMTETLQPTGQQVIKSYPNKKFKNSRKFSSLRGEGAQEEVTSFV